VIGFNSLDKVVSTKEKAGRVRPPPSVIDTQLKISTPRSKVKIR